MQINFCMAISKPEPLNIAAHQCQCWGAGLLGNVILAGGNPNVNWGVLWQCGPVIDMPVPKWHHVPMQPAMEERRKRITARVTDSVRDTLEQAAELLGSTVNQFVVQAAYLEAQRVMERESVIRLSQKDASQVLALLDNPPKPSKRLKEAVKAFKATVRV